MVVVGFVVTTDLVVGWFVFLFGFAVWASFGCDFAVGDSLVNMGVCCGSAVSVVSAC